MFPQLPFVVKEEERHLLTPTIAGQAKNVSLDPSTATLRGGTLSDVNAER